MLAFDLTEGICTGIEFHNWAVDGRNDLAWLTWFDPDGVGQDRRTLIITFHICRYHVINIFSLAGTE